MAENAAYIATWLDANRPVGPEGPYISTFRSASESTVWRAIIFSGQSYSETFSVGLFVDMESEDRSMVYDTRQVCEGRGGFNPGPNSLEQKLEVLIRGGGGGHCYR